MATKTSWHRYGTKLRHCHPMYTSNKLNKSSVKRCVFRARREAACESVSLTLTRTFSTLLLFQTSGPQTEKARRPNWFVVRRVTTMDLAADRSWWLMLRSTDAECDEVFKIRRETLVEDIVHGCGPSYFENNKIQTDIPTWQLTITPTLTLTLFFHFFCTNNTFFSQLEDMST